MSTSPKDRDYLDLSALYGTLIRGRDWGDPYDSDDEEPLSISPWFSTKPFTEELRFTCPLCDECGDEYDFDYSTYCSRSGDEYTRCIVCDGCKTYDPVASQLCDDCLCIPDIDLDVTTVPELCEDCRLIQGAVELRERLIDAIKVGNLQHQIDIARAEFDNKTRRSREKADTYSDEANIRELATALLYPRSNDQNGFYVCSGWDGDAPRSVVVGSLTDAVNSKLPIIARCSTKEDARRVAEFDKEWRGQANEHTPTPASPIWIAAALGYKSLPEFVTAKGSEWVERVLDYEKNRLSRRSVEGAFSPTPCMSASQTYAAHMMRHWYLNQGVSLDLARTFDALADALPDASYDDVEDLTKAIVNAEINDDDERDGRNKLIGGVIAAYRELGGASVELLLATIPTQEGIPT